MISNMRSFYDLSESRLVRQNSMGTLADVVNRYLVVITGTMVALIDRAIPDDPIAQSVRTFAGRAPGASEPRIWS